MMNKKEVKEKLEENQKKQQFAKTMGNAAFKIVQYGLSRFGPSGAMVASMTPKKAATATLSDKDIAEQKRIQKRLARQITKK